MFVVGHRAKLVQELRAMYGIPIKECPEWFDKIDMSKFKKAVPLDEHHYLFCHATQMSKQLNEQTSQEVERSLVCAISTISMCDHVLQNNPIARICIIDSIDAERRGCYDTTYCLGKIMIHGYVRTRRIASPDQQLVCIAPSLIRDGGLVTCRDDLDKVDARIPELPKQSFIMSKDVAKFVHFVLFEDSGHITNTVLEMHGGIHSTMKGTICPL